MAMNVVIMKGATVDASIGFFAIRCAVEISIEALLWNISDGIVDVFNKTLKSIFVRDNPASDTPFQ